MTRYRFSDFTLAPQQRLLIRDGQEVPLIPRYFDLLLLLVERRHEAVHRREIFERVWGEVTVSESALTQAVRTIRRTLDDDPKEPRFIRTVSRHGYQFVFPDVVEESGHAAPHDAPPAAAMRVEPAVIVDEPPRRDVSGAATRGAMGGAMAGIVAGGLGGLILAVAPDSTAPLALAPVLGVIAGVAGAVGGAGVGAGLALAGAAARGNRILMLALGGALGGGVVGGAVQWLTRWGLVALVGLDLKVGGGLEGLLIGGAAGLAVAIATNKDEGFETADAQTRVRAALIAAATCGLAGLALTLSGRQLAGGTINAIAHAAEGSRATLAPLGRLMGESDFGPLSSAILSLAECSLFGAGFAAGLLRRRF